jgi:hypothetical protein
MIVQNSPAIDTSSCETVVKMLIAVRIYSFTIQSIRSDQLQIGT